VGTDTFGGGPHFVNIQNPLVPVGEGGDASEGYCHDAQVVTYEGPDTDYTGREILFGSNEDKVVIIDVTDKGNPQTISTIAYSNVHYTHQGWLTEDQRYFLLGDEADEIDLGIHTRTIVFDFNDLDDPQFHFEYSGPEFATDHNGYVKGDKFYLSNNTAGLRVVDLSDIASGTMTETGFFDSYPSNNNAGYNGAWNVYPFFESGNIVISDRSSGFLLVKSQLLSITDQEDASGIVLFPNPASDQLNITSEKNPIEHLRITNVLGQTVFNIDTGSETLVTLDISSLESGLYFVAVNNSVTKKILKK
jgi:choice-of-anchor B domain-containing protein